MDINVKDITKLNNNVVGLLENPFVKYGFLIFIVIRIIFIDRMEDWYLNLFSYTSFKVIYALLVAYSACFDPVYAIALATFIIICIQEIYMRNAKKAVVASVSGNGISGNGKILKLPASGTITPQEVRYETMPDQSMLVNDANVYNLINRHTLQRVPNADDKLIAEYDYYIDPAYKTLTANVDKPYLGANKIYITDDALMKAQTNQEPNVSQNVAVQAFPVSMNIQGLPNGFDKGVGGANPELASITSA